MQKLFEKKLLPGFIVEVVFGDEPVILRMKNPDNILYEAKVIKYSETIIEEFSDNFFNKYGEVFASRLALSVQAVFANMTTPGKQCKIDFSPLFSKGISPLRFVETFSYTPSQLAEIQELSVAACENFSYYDTTFMQPLKNFPEPGVYLLGVVTNFTEDEKTVAATYAHSDGEALQVCKAIQYFSFNDAEKEWVDKGIGIEEDFTFNTGNECHA